MQHSEKISIIIVSYNAIEYVSRCISSIIEHSKNYEYEIIVIDNNSETDALNVLKEIRKAGQIQHLVQNKENTLLTRAQNQGLKLATGQFVLFLNPDTEFFDENWFINLTQPFNDSDKKIGITGPIYNFVALRPTYGNIDMCCFCVSRDLLEAVGPLDERYPWNGAGFAYTCEAWAKGFKYMHTPINSFKHHGSKSRASKSIPNVHFDLRKEMQQRGLNPKYDWFRLLKYLLFKRTNDNH